MGGASLLVSLWLSAAVDAEDKLLTLTTISAVDANNWTEVKFDNAAGGQLLANNGKGSKFAPFIEGKDAVNHPADGLIHSSVQTAASHFHQSPTP